MERDVDVLEYAKEILEGVKTGALLTARAGGKPNTMTISWGTLGIEWNRTIFTAFVRPSRHTFGMLEKNAEFTVSVPMEGSPRRLAAQCGTHSGRDVDKAAEFGFSYVEGKSVSVPGVAEYPLVLECKTVYVQPQDEKAYAHEDLARFYPAGEDGSRDVHVAFVGEIVRARLLE